VNAKKAMNLMKIGKDMGNMKIGKAISFRKAMSF
jgi:hypothetical protein